MARLIEHDESPAVVSEVDSEATAVGGERDSRGWPLLLTGPLAAIAAFVLTAIIFAVPVFAVWLTMPVVGPEWDTWQEVARIVGLAWMAGQGFPVTVSGLLVTLLPWGLATITFGLLLLAGRWAARTAVVSTPMDALVVTLSGTVVYAALALSVSTWIADPGTGPGRVLLTSVAVGIASLGTGVTQGAGLLSVVRRSIPAPLRRIIAAAVVAVAVLIVAAAVAVGASLVMHADQTHRLLISLAPDAAGFAVIVLLSIGYLPVLIVWGISYLLGTGFIISSGVVISPFAVPGDAPLPVFPLLGALPQTPPPGAQALPIIGLVAGMLAAGVLRRRGAHGWPLLTETAGVVALASALLTGLLIAASGSLGGERLAGIGPIVGPTIGVAALLWGVGSLIIVIPALASARTPKWEPGDSHDDTGGDRRYERHGE